MTVYSAAITLLLVMDPFGNIPAFLSILKDYTGPRRRIIILREMSFALVILVLFLFFGKYILAAMSISETALGIAGGVILFFIAIRMIFPTTARRTETAVEEPMIVPLAVPLVAGPSSMAVVILFSTGNPGKIGALLIALFSAWLVSLIVLLFSDGLHRIVGRRGLNALQRLMGMILTTMAVQMLLDGIDTFVHHV